MKNAVVTVAVWLATCVSSAHGEMLTFSGPTMGTAYHIRVVPGKWAVDLPQLKKHIEALLSEIDWQMSTYRDNSELSKFNRSTDGEWFAVSEATAEIVHVAHDISRKTDGALDVTVGPLVRLWHFGPNSSTNGRARFKPPDDGAVLAARKLVGYERLGVRRDPPALRKHISGLEVDLSSIAPGYAVDQMAALLGQHGIDSFLVELGGEIRVAGRRDGGKPWRVAIERPLVERREMQMALTLEDAAISTAGDYRKHFEHEGRLYSHIIDPSTGRPVEHALASVTVAADTCLEADAWDTALLVMGPERGFSYAENNGIAALFIMRGETNYDVRTTSAWKRRFEKQI
jgi:FAD:protein FMN transferase